MSTLFDAHGWKAIMAEAPLPDGRVKKQVRVGRADSVHIIAFADDEKILLLREFRPFYGEYIWQLPTGRVDKESDIEGGARRELQEETGFDAQKIEFCISANHSETFMCTNHVFVARDLIKSPLPQDADELIEVHELPIDEALEKVLASTKVHLPSAFALMWYLRKQGE